MAALEGTSGACGSVLYSEHSQKDDGDHVVSLLRLVHRTTTSRGRRLIVEAPVTHPAKPRHCPGQPNGSAGGSKSPEALAPLVAYELDGKHSGGVLVHAHWMQPWKASGDHATARKLVRAMSDFVAGNVAFLRTTQGQELLTRLRKGPSSPVRPKGAELGGVAVPPDMKNFLEDCIAEGESADPDDSFSFAEVQGVEEEENGRAAERPEWVEEAVQRRSVETAIENWDTSWGGGKKVPATGEDMEFADEGLSGAGMVLWHSIVRGQRPYMTCRVLLSGPNQRCAATAGPSTVRSPTHRAPVVRREVYSDLSPLVHSPRII